MEFHPTPSNEEGTTREVPAPATETGLRQLADRVLRRALRLDARGAGELDVEMGVALRQLCEVARERGVHAEQLLVVLKESWRGLPETRLVMRRDTTQVLGRVISKCVVAYYAPPRADA